MVNQTFSIAIKIFSSSAHLVSAWNPFDEAEKFSENVIWWSVSKLLEEVSELSLGDHTVFSDVDLVEEVIEVKFIVFVLQLHFVEGLIDEFFDFSLVDVAIVVEIIGLPDILDPLSDVVIISAYAVLNNVVWVTILIIGDLSKTQPEYGNQIFLDPVFSLVVVIHEHAKTYS